MTTVTVRGTPLRNLLNIAVGVEDADRGARAREQEEGKGLKLALGGAWKGVRRDEVRNLVVGEAKVEED